MSEDAPLSDRWTSASEIVRQVVTGTRSAVEVTTEAIARIERLNPVYDAVTFFAPEEALATARAIDRRRAQSGGTGALAGVPTLMKDLYGYRPAWPTTLGGLPGARDDTAPDSVWSRYPDRINRSDGVLLGQTNSSTFGFRGVTDNALFGPSTNPFDPTRNPGGSSGGSATAVAAGMVPLAGASDAGGSIRIPAAWTNTFGFQPSAGRVPSTPRPSLFHLGPHLYEGPITRTVEDALLAFNVLRGFDPHDPYSAPSPSLSPNLLFGGVRGKRIGLSLDFGGFPVNPLVREAVLKSAEVFERLGAVVEPVSINLTFSHEELTRMWLRSMGTLMLADLEGFRLRGFTAVELGVPEAVLYWTEEARRMTLDEVLRDRVMRTAVLDGLLSAIEDRDLLIGPTVVDLPVLNALDGSTVGPTEVSGVPVDPLIGWCPTYLTNFSGSPSASVPAGLVNGLPVGMMIIGKKHQDEEIFTAAAAFEEAHPWTQNYALVR